MEQQGHRVCSDNPSPSWAGYSTSTACSACISCTPRSEGAQKHYLWLMPSVQAHCPSPQQYQKPSPPREAGTHYNDFIFSLKNLPQTPRQSSAQIRDFLCEMLHNHRKHELSLESNKTQHLPRAMMQCRQPQAMLQQGKR